MFIGLALIFLSKHRKLSLWGFNISFIAFSALYMSAPLMDYLATKIEYSIVQTFFMLVAVLTFLAYHLKNIDSFGRTITRYFKR